MRNVVFGFCLMLGCQRAARTTAISRPTMRAATLFTDSALYRARCKEADTVGKLTVIPPICTPRDQRVIFQ
jgi:hypothetical protein